MPRAQVYSHQQRDKCCCSLTLSESCCHLFPKDFSLGGWNSVCSVGSHWMPHLLPYPGFHCCAVHHCKSQEEGKGKGEREEGRGKDGSGGCTHWNLNNSNVFFLLPPPLINVEGVLWKLALTYLCPLATCVMSKALTHIAADTGWYLSFVYALLKARGAINCESVISEK